MASVSRTVGESQIVEELAISFTHTTAIDWLLPGVAPTGKPVEMAVAVIVGFKDGKVSGTAFDRQPSEKDLKALNERRRGDGSGVKTGFQKRD